MQRTIATFSLLLVSLLAFGAQSCEKKPAESQQQDQTTPIPVAAQELQWEYLVVSFGKTYFSTPSEEPEISATGFSKLVGYAQLGLDSAQEAPLTQKQMDSLGKFGWELVGIVGAIGGDQQLVFKRRFDPMQSNKEAELIRQEGEKLLAAKKATEERLARLAANPTQELIELDEYEKEAARAKARQNEEQRLKEALAGIVDSRTNVISVSSTASGPRESEAKVTIAYNGTEDLLEGGNKYRKSEAEKLALQVAKEICSAAKLKGITSSRTWAREIVVTVNVNIRFQGKTTSVASAEAAGNWPERPLRY